MVADQANDEVAPGASSVCNEVSGTVIGPVIQAGSLTHVGRDQHIHYSDGVRGQRRTVPGALVRECPYPGLAAFGPQQAGWFFGRDGLVAELAARLDQRLRTGGMQMVVAPSGAGKSSLLRAGLLPRLAQAALPGSDRWPTVVFTPTADPLWVLAANIALLTGADVVAVVEELTADPSRCLSMLSQALRGHAGDRDPNARVVVVVDQFEELFTLCTDYEQRRIVIDLLVQIAGGSGAGVDPVGLVVVGVRADFYAACVDHPGLRAALQDAPLVVGPMSEAELREAIRYPAQAVGLDIEQGLVELLLRDLGVTGAAGVAGAGSYEAGRLPLLAHALRVSWQQRHGATLTVQGYQDTGGIQHAVATTAELVYTGLDDAGRRVAQWLFLRLVKIGDGTEDTRRHLSHAELMTTSAEPPTVAAVLGAFTQERLLTQQQNNVEITHEALLHGWPRLRGWIDTDRAGRLVHQNLEEAAADWDRGRRDSSVLYRGSRLEVAHTWAATAPPGDLSPTGHAFLAAGIQARRGTARRRTVIIAALAVLALVASTAAVVAFQQQREVRSQQREALRQRDIAIHNQVITQADLVRPTDVSLSAQLNLVAHRAWPDDETYTRLVTAASAPLSTSLTGHTGPVFSAAFSPDGHTLATSSNDSTVRLWNIADPTQPAPLGQPLTGPTGPVNSVAFSPDGHTLATASIDTTVRLWNITDPTQPTSLGQPLTGHTSVVASVAFSPDGKLATGGGDATVRLWEMNVDKAIERICAVTRNTLTAEKWRRYIGDDVPYKPPCP